MCPVCELHIWTHEPGVSYIGRGGMFYHPACYEREMPLADAVADYMMKATARHIEAQKHLDEKLMKAVKAADDMEDRVEIARVIRDCWGATTFEIEGN